MLAIYCMLNNVVKKTISSAVELVDWVNHAKMAYEVLL